MDNVSSVRSTDSVRTGVTDSVGAAVGFGGAGALGKSWMQLREKLLVHIPMLSLFATFLHPFLYCFAE
jgi:hypothetical protein